MEQAQDHDAVALDSEGELQTEGLNPVDIADGDSGTRTFGNPATKGERVDSGVDLGRGRNPPLSFFGDYLPPPIFACKDDMRPPEW